MSYLDSSGLSTLWAKIKGMFATKTELATKQNTLTFDTTPTANSTNPVTSGGVKTYVDSHVPTMDDVPTAGSSNPVKSGGIKSALDTKQNTLTFDSAPTASSTNPVTSGGVKAALDAKADNSALATTNTNVAANATAIANLQAAYAALTQSDIVVVESADWPVSEPSQNTIYRVTGTTSYSDYMWDGSSFVEMATYNNGIDATPTANSDKLVTSGGVFDAVSSIAEGITEYNLVMYANRGDVQINSSNKYTGVSAPNGSRFYYILPNESYIVVPQTGLATIIAVLKDIDNVANGNTPKFATGFTGRTVVTSGTTYQFTSPSDGNYLYMISQPTSQTYDIGTITHIGLNEKVGEMSASVDSLDSRMGSVEFLAGLSAETLNYSKQQCQSLFVFQTNKLYDATNSLGKGISQVTTSSATPPAYMFKIPISGKAEIKYPVFKTTSGYGCLVTNSSDVVIAQYANATLETGTIQTIVTSDSARYFYFSAPASLSNLSDYTLTITQAKENGTEDTDKMLLSARVGWLPFLSDLSNTSKTSLNLTAIRFEFNADKIPFQRGYLFHKNNPDDKTIFYGTKLDNATQVGTLDYYPAQCVIGVSPKDGTIIGVKRDARDVIHVFQNGQNYAVDAKSSDGTNTSPKGWLYNSGCEFIVDGSNEYCIFAEYDGSATNNQRLYIWKGTYPYTSASDWKTVAYKTTSYNPVVPGTITHWHMIRRDPWSGIIYCTSGDFSGQFFWMYSNDLGETWTELASDSNISTKPSWVLDGQPLRCINFIFTADYIYFATDHGSNNTLSRIQRAQSGLIDIETREILSDLPYGIAVNSLCYVESPNGLFMFTRIDTGFTTEYAKDIPVLFWSLLTGKMYTIARLKQIAQDWGGHRGKCYFNYTNGQETRPAMGFALNTPCGFDLIGADGTAIGTIFYDF